ncbi:hypothetical protein [Halohasta litchfieldiae]|nr:hypothetical protein [Halohasta litchfieldiae]
MVSESREVDENRLYNYLTRVARLTDVAIIDADLLGDSVVTPYQQQVELELCRLLLDGLEFLIEFFASLYLLVVEEFAHRLDSLLAVLLGCGGGVDLPKGVLPNRETPVDVWRGIEINGSTASRGGESISVVRFGGR